MENIAVAVDAGHTSLWGLFMQAGWVVKLVMIGLVAASVWSWAIVFEKMVSFRKMRAAIDRFEQVFWSGQSLEELYRSLADRQTIGMGTIFVAAMREWKKSYERGARSAIGLQMRIEKSMDVGEQARIFGDGWLVGSVCRAVRDCHRHHDVVSGHCRIQEYQSRSRGTRYRGSATRYGYRASGSHPRRYRFQQALLGGLEDRDQARRVRGRVLRHTLAANR
jgi:hypothetical protein